MAEIKFKKIFMVQVKPYFFCLEIFLRKIHSDFKKSFCDKINCGNFFSLVFKLCILTKFSIMIISIKICLLKNYINNKNKFFFLSKRNKIFLIYLIN